jgi:hypothetical protein
MGILHEDLHAFLCVDVTGWGIVSQTHHAPSEFDDLQNIFFSFFSLVFRSLPSVYRYMINPYKSNGGLVEALQDSGKDQLIIKMFLLKITKNCFS